jgi:DNA-binding MarR family transcriptional regulator
MVKKAAEESARERVIRDGDRLRAGPTPTGPLVWDDIAFLTHGMSFASQPLLKATAAVTKRYDLGPRGAWILNLVEVGLVFPHELAEMLRIGRSLVSAELARLTEAGLITSRQGTRDRRRTELALTEAGQAVRAEIQGELARMVTETLAHYSPAELRLCARILSDMRNAAAPIEDGAGRSE